MQMKIHNLIDRKFILSCSIVYLVIWVGQAKTALAQIPEICAGVAQVEITPPIGYSHHRGTSTGVHDPLIMKDGTVRTNAGVGNPDIIRLAGPIDTEVGILFLHRASDNLPLASLTGFANHTDTFGGTEFSADYPSYLAKELTAALGGDFISVFGLGASGGLNHVNVNNESNRIFSKHIGEKLAALL